MIKGLHHSAYRCRDSEETRKFYEDFLGLKLVGSLAIKDSPAAAKADVLHTFFQMDDGSCLAFFEAPAMPFEFKRQLDFDLHIALEVDAATLQAMFVSSSAPLALSVVMTGALTSSARAFKSSAASA